MGLRKSSPPPFEIMSRTWSDTTEQAEEVDLTDRHRRPVSIGAPEEEDEIVPTITQKPVAKPAKEPEPSAPDRWGKIGWRDWMRDILDRAPLVLRVPRGYVMVGVALLSVFIGLAYWIGHDRGTRDEPAPAAQQPADQNLLALSNALNQGSPVLTAGNETSNNTGDRGANTSGNGNNGGQQAGILPGLGQQTTPQPDQPKPKLARGTTDPRAADKRYFVLAAYSVNKEEYMTPLLQYLWAQGVEAGAFNSHNSGLYEVIALQGFSKSELDSDSRRTYESLLRRVGKNWKQQASGNNDLGGMYPRRFDGTPTRKSITKAN